MKTFVAKLTELSKRKMRNEEGKGGAKQANRKAQEIMNDGSKLGHVFSWFK